jgi:subtilisin family serine protease
MRNTLYLLLVLGIAAPLGAKALIGPQLEQILQSTRAGDKVEVLIVMKDQSDEEYLALTARDLPRREQRYPVVNELKRLSAQTQAPLMALLADANRSAQVSEIQSFWIVNAVYCKATPAVIEAIAGIESVEYLESPYFVCDNILLVEGKPVPVPPTRTVEWNVRLVAADSCWTLGFKGQGIIVGHIDTGCNYNHMDLRNHMWTDANYPLHGWNFELNTNDPMDVSGHGTHTAGTVGSDGSAGDSCGMAPQCSLMCCRVRTSIAYPMPDTISEKNVLDAMQFVIAPPNSPTHGADLVTMSLGWYVAWTPRRSLWRKGVTNVALAGMPFFIAAGNERGSTYCPTPYNLRCPGDVPPPWHHSSEAAGRLAGAISIAATDNLDALASFSSTGPSCWENAMWYWDYPWRPGSGIMKPDMAAPGVNITSCNYASTNGYVSGWSGTSMATPCCAGVAAVILSKNPNLTVCQVDSLMQFTALDLGTAGKDTLFGNGRIRARQAINATPAAGSWPELHLADKGTAILDPGPTGNGNAYFDPSETATLVDTLVNLGSATATTITGVLRTANTHILIVDSLAAYGTINAKARGNNAGNPFVIKADTLINLGDIVTFTLALTAGSYTKTLNFDVRMGSVTGPDSMGYYMLDNTDTLYTQAPVYNWMELNHGGPGTSLGAGGPMVTVQTPLPFVFRHFTKRLAASGSLSICSNGWFCPGTQAVTVQHNSNLPKIVDYGNQATVPNQIAVFWDTLNTASPASWWYYNDAANHRFIVEWDSATGVLAYAQVFEAIIYDTTTAGRFGCNDIVLQYKVVREPTSCTVGQQDSLKVWGWTYLFNKIYDDGAEPLVTGRAIKFTTKIPKMRNWLVSVHEFDNYPDMGNRLVVVTPNPGHQRVNVYYNVTTGGRVTLKVYNTAGQLVRTLFAGQKNPGVYSIRWNGTDDRNRIVSSGVYFYRLESSGKTVSARGVFVR